MKKLLTILLFAALAFTVKAQYKIYSDGVRLNGVDSVETFYYPVRLTGPRQYLNGPWLVSVHDDSITTADIYVTVGMGDSSTDFGELTITNWPYELGTDSVTTETAYIHGRKATGDQTAGLYLVVKYYFDPDAVTPAATDTVWHRVIMWEK